MTLAIDMGTHCYVGSLECGCGVAITRDMPGFKKDTARDVAGFIKDGLSVARLPNDEASKAFSARCANYPHTKWQIRDEAAIAKAEGQ